MIVKAVIDRFEGTKAVLFIGGDERQVIWHRRDLPQNAKEGDHLRVVIDLDARATAQAGKEAAELLKELTGEG